MKVKSVHAGFHTAARRECPGSQLSLFMFLLSYSKMNADKRVESPIPLLPLSTPDEETEKLIKKKDEEVSRKRFILINPEY